VKVFSPAADGRNPVPEPERVLQIVFESAEALEREYKANLANGGIFIETNELFEPREMVTVVLELGDRLGSLRLAGEVVHVVSREMADLGAKPGVAVQLEGAAHELRSRLEPLLRAGGVSPHQACDQGRRAAPRSAARVPARIGVDHEVIEGHARNLSQSGVLVSLSEAEIPVGHEVSVTLADPTTGREMQVQGRVARQVRAESGEVAAVGVQFDPPASRRADVDHFVNHLQTTEHTRRLGSITGPIDALGTGGLIQVFGRASPRGTLFLRSGAHEGQFGFEDGLLCYARAGSAKGMEALEQILSWKGGEFEFCAHLDPIDGKEPPLPIEAALLEAARRHDEGRRTHPDRLSPNARLCVANEDAAKGQVVTGAMEEAILDLARAGCTVRRLLDVVPEPDDEIFAALVGLIDQGVILLDS
jgi:Tfp pilus assembly protein PilZ